MTTAVATLVLGLPTALFVLWPLLFRRREAPEELRDDTRAELEAEKSLALRALRELDLERETGLLADQDYAELRARYEARASTVLKRLDALGPAPAPPPAAVPAAPTVARPAAERGLPWTQRPAVLAAGAAGLIAFGLVLGMLVVRYTAPTPPDPMAASGGPTGAPLSMAAPGPTPGAAAGPAGGTPGQPLPPEVFQGMLQAAHTSLDAGRYQEAIAAYKAVLQRDPANVDAITHLGVILAVAGHADSALEAFDRALALDPSYAHAWWDKARVLHEQKQDYAGAIPAWERFLALAPPGPDREQAEQRIAEARSRLGTPPASPAAAAPGPAAPPPRREEPRR